MIKIFIGNRYGTCLSDKILLLLNANSTGPSLSLRYLNIYNLVRFFMLQVLQSGLDYILINRMPEWASTLRANKSQCIFPE